VTARPARVRRRWWVALGVVVLVVGAILWLGRDPSLPSPFRIPYSHHGIDDLDRLNPGFWRFIDAQRASMGFTGVPSRIIVVDPVTGEELFRPGRVRLTASHIGDLMSSYRILQSAPRSEKGRLIAELDRFVEALRSRCETKGGSDSAWDPMAACAKVHRSDDVAGAAYSFACPRDLGWTGTHVTIELDWRCRQAEVDYLIDFILVATLEETNAGIHRFLERSRRSR